MPTSLPSSDRHHLLAALAAQPSGMGIDRLYAALAGKVPRRTLQRRLAVLVRDHQVVAEGAGRARRYRLAPTQIEAAFPEDGDHLDATIEVYVPTSPEGEAVKAAVRQPLQQRRPVAYQISFLEAYEPNQTCYLPQPLRAQLLSMGRSSAAHQAPTGTFARNILGRLLIDLAWASSRLEGNTYTRLDTERLIEFGQAAEGKDAFETQMILNHKAAIEYLVGDAGVAVNADTVVALHALLSDDLLRDPMAGGRVRQRAVEIGGSVYLPIALPQRLEELFGITVRMAAAVSDPFEQAFFLMVHLPYLQPFEDVNKRVSRLAANIPLIRHNLSPLSFIDVPAQSYVDGMLGVYELTRVELLRDVFVWAYERSCQQYVAMRQQLVPPDTFRLRYRAELGTVVKAIMQQGLVLDEASIERVVPSTVTAEDRERFMTQVRTEFASLHEGNAVRFGLRPLEWAGWRATQSPR